jgi:hypothetical protein
MRACLFAICVAVVPVGTAHAVYDVSPRLVSLASGQALATYGYDDAGDSSSGNPIYLTPNPNRVFAYFFGDFGDPYFDEDPGIHALATTSGYTSSNLPTGSWLSFDVLSDLQYWNGTNNVSFGSVPAGETLQLYPPSQPPGVTVGTGTGFQAGFPIQNVDANGGMHKHLWTELVAGTNSTPADGIYMFEMRLKLLQSNAQTPYPGVAPSLPFFVLFDNNESLATFQQAENWVQSNLVPFGDFNRDGLVNAADISSMMNALTNLPGYQAANHLTNFDLMAFGDINSDGKFNIADLQALLNLFKTGQYALAPEPASWILLATGGIVALYRLRKNYPVRRPVKESDPHTNKE